MAEANITVAVTVHDCRECATQPCEDCPGVLLPSTLELDAEQLAGASLSQRNLLWHSNATALLRAMAAEIGVLRHELAQRPTKNAP